MVVYWCRGGVVLWWLCGGVEMVVLVTMQHVKFNLHLPYIDRRMVMALPRTVCSFSTMSLT